jgi:hypothetical protein
VFTCAPDLARSSADACAEGGAGTGTGAGVAGTGTRGCSKSQVTEADFDRFDPSYCPPGVEHIVPPWTLGGAASRDISRSRRFQKLLRATCDERRWRCVASGLPKRVCADATFI